MQKFKNDIPMQIIAYGTIEVKEERHMSEYISFRVVKRNITILIYFK